MKETKTRCSYEKNRRNVERNEKNIESSMVDDFVHLPSTLFNSTFNLPFHGQREMLLKARRKIVQKIRYCLKEENVAGKIIPAYHKEIITYIVLYRIL